VYDLKNNKFIFESIENYKNNEKVDFNNLTIEHFMPQKLSPQWIVKLGDKHQEIHDKYLHTFGNLSLTGDNYQLGNKSFEEKKKILTEKSKLKLNQFFIKSNNWTEKEILNRANSLFEESKKIWFYPKNYALQIEVNNEEKEFYTLDDDLDLTGKKPSSFELFGESVKTNSWKELLFEFLKKFYMMDENKTRSLLLDDDFIGRKRKFLSTSQDNEKGSQVEISSGFFVETNLSANAIINYIKLVASKFDLKNDDFIYVCR